QERDRSVTLPRRFVARERGVLVRAGGEGAVEPVGGERAVGGQTAVLILLPRAVRNLVRAGRGGFQRRRIRPGVVGVSLAEHLDAVPRARTLALDGARQRQQVAEDVRVLGRAVGPAAELRRVTGRRRDDRDEVDLPEGVQVPGGGPQESRVVAVIRARTLQVLLRGANQLVPDAEEGVPVTDGGQTAHRDDLGLEAARQQVAHLVG